MSKVYTKKLNKNISLTDRRQILIKNSLFYIANITIMVTSIYVFLVVVVRFTHFKWLSFKELIRLIITQF